MWAEMNSLGPPFLRWSVASPTATWWALLWRNDIATSRGARSPRLKCSGGMTQRERTPERGKTRAEPAIADGRRVSSYVHDN